MKPENSSTARTGSRVSLREQAYTTLKRRILNCELRPGETVTVSRLAVLLRMGRTPVSQAVDRLMLDGLVDVMPRKGVVVSPVSLDHLVQIIEVRLMNEGQAARWAAQNASRAHIRQMQENIRKMHKASAMRDVAELIALDSEFHKLIASAARNAILSDILGNLHDRSLRFWTCLLYTSDAADE